MNEQKIMQHDFKSDYEQLELDDRAGWDQAKANYRRLVHLWHPDRYAQRPRERTHAQQQFILLTKSYDNLKSFERENGRLPFEPAKMRREPEKVTSEKQKRRSQKTAKNDTPNDLSNDTSNDSPVDSTHNVDDLQPGALSRDDRATDQAVIKATPWGKILWSVCGASLLLATVVTFYLIDRSTNQKVIETGREAIRAAPPSEFMPSAAEIRRSESRGAFIQPTK